MHSHALERADVDASGRAGGYVADVEFGLGQVLEDVLGLGEEYPAKGGQRQLLLALVHSVSPQQAGATPVHMVQEMLVGLQL